LKPLLDERELGRENIGMYASGTQTWVFVININNKYVTDVNQEQPKLL
jgi:hypothetical protein